MSRKYELEAEKFTKAIVKIAKNPQAVENFNCYLSLHFENWLRKYASTPEDLALEMEEFANMYDD